MLASIRIRFTSERIGLCPHLQQRRQRASAVNLFGNKQIGLLKTNGQPPTLNMEVVALRIGIMVQSSCIEAVRLLFCITMRSDNPKNNKNVAKSLENNKNVATSDLSRNDHSTCEIFYQTVIAFSPNTVFIT